MRPFGSSAALAVVLIALGAGVVGLQLARERLELRTAPSDGVRNVLYVRSPEVVARASLSFRSLVADTYWIRALQHFGRTRLSQGQGEYELLYPLLDLTTALDPRFNVAYRFGAIFLTEPPPGGPGRPDEAIRLLKKGLQAQPTRWEFAQDIGFVYYNQGDYANAAEWFSRAADIPGAPNWMRPLVAVTLTEGGNRTTSRFMWNQMLENAEEEWVRAQARLRLRQLDTLDQIDALEDVTRAYEARTGAPPQSWEELARAGYIRGIPVDLEGLPFKLNPWWGDVTLDPKSPLNPLPTGQGARR